MTTIQLLACIGMITGSFLLFGLAPMEFTDGLFSFLTREKSSIKDEIKAAQRRQKQGFLKREIRMAQDILTMTGRSKHFSLLCACSLLLFGIGASIAIVLGNFFLAPVMAVGFMLLRVVDPDLETLGSKAYAIQAPFTSPLFGGDIVTALIPMAIATYGNVKVGLVSLAIFAACILIAMLLGCWHKPDRAYKNQK